MISTSKLSEKDVIGTWKQTDLEPLFSENMSDVDKEQLKEIKQSLKERFLHYQSSGVQSFERKNGELRASPTFLFLKDGTYKAIMDEGSTEGTDGIWTLGEGKIFIYMENLEVSVSIKEGKLYIPFSDSSNSLVGFYIFEKQ